MAYAVVRTDRMTGTTDSARLVTVKYFDGENNPAPIENGTWVKLDGLVEGEREVFKATAPAKDTPITEMALIANPEVMYDERKKNLDEYINEADTLIRAYLPVNMNIYSVTAEAFSNAEPDDIEVGQTVELTADSEKPTVVASPTADTTTIGEIIEIEQTRRYKYYAVLIKA